ncbi:hypothetical protein [Streptomyces zhihengii]
MLRRALTVLTVTAALCGAAVVTSPPAANRDSAWGSDTTVTMIDTHTADDSAWGRPAPAPAPEPSPEPTDPPAAPDDSAWG